MHQHHVTVILESIHAHTKQFYEQHGFTCVQRGHDLVASRDGLVVEYKTASNSPAPTDGKCISFTICDERCHSTELELMDPNGVKLVIKPPHSPLHLSHLHQPTPNHHRTQATTDNLAEDDDAGSIQTRFDSPISLTHGEPDLAFIKRPLSTNRIAFMTSGGDSQGMNAAIRAIVRTAIAHKCHPMAIYDGFSGLIRGGPEDIKEMSWDDVAFLLSEGGTAIRSSRCAEFMERAGRRKAVKNLLSVAIDKLIVIGGDGSLTGADTLRSEWPELVQELVDGGQVPADSLQRHPYLMVVGLVGSIDNDMSGTEITIGANTSLHRITEAVDNIRTTATSHTRAFIVEVMGRRCGWLALNAALAVGADWLLIPESPPPGGWETSMCRMLQRNRDLGKKATIVIIAEGAVDRHNQPIRAQHIQSVLTEHLHLDSRITTLGHVQRGGAPSAYDRYLGTVQGVRAVRCLLSADPATCPSLLVVQRENKVGVEVLRECVERTKSVADAMRSLDFERVFMQRDPDFINSHRLLQSLGVYDPQSPGTQPPAPLKTIAVMHCGAPCAGMNAAVWAMVYYCLFRGYRVLGVGNGFAFSLEDDVRDLRWSDVEGWMWRGGCDLGTNRTVPDVARVQELVKRYSIDGLIVIGGFEMFTALLALRKQLPIPILGVPATISNNVPGTDYSIGSDTALNVIVEACDAIKQSASSSRKRVFVVEVQGGNCGYLATVAGLGSGATYSYIPEEGLSLKDLQRDIVHFKRRFKDDKKQGRLVLRNEAVSSTYTTELISKIFEAESGGDFDSRWIILGHLQQGGVPSPMDRIRAIRLAVLCVKRIEQQDIADGDAELIGISGPTISFTPVQDLVPVADMELRAVREPWWMELRPVVRMLAKYGPCLTVPVSDLNGL